MPPQSQDMFNGQICVGSWLTRGMVGVLFSGIEVASGRGARTRIPCPTTMSLISILSMGRTLPYTIATWDGSSSFELPMSILVWKITFARASHRRILAVISFAYWDNFKAVAHWQWPTGGRVFSFLLPLLIFTPLPHQLVAALATKHDFDKCRLVFSSFRVSKRQLEGGERRAEPFRLVVWTASVAT